MLYPNTLHVHTPHISLLDLTEFFRNLRHIFVRYWRRAVIFTVSFFMLTLVVQLAYPANRALPFARIAGQPVGLGSEGSIRSILSELQQQSVAVKTANKTYSASLSEIGLEIDIEASVQRTVDYPLSQRIVPLSMLFNGHERQSEQVVVRVNELKIHAFAQKIADENYAAPVEGSIVIEGIVVTVKAPISGISYDAEELAKTLKGLGAKLPGSVNLPAKTVPAGYSQVELEAAAAKARAILGQPFTISTLGQEQQFQPTEVAGWLGFVPNPITKTIDVEFNRGLIKNSLQAHAASVHLAPGWNTVTTLDGVETTRSPGTAGHMLDMDKTVEAVVSGLLDSSYRTAGVVAGIAPSARVDRNYSATSIGLQHLLDDWVADNPGASWGSVVRELGSQQRYAAIRQNDQFLSASVYKLFLAYSVLAKVDEGSLDPNALTATGSTVNTCIEYMIVQSHNACSHALGDIAGWDSVTAMQHAKGFSSTRLSLGGGFYTTANDTTEILEQLYTGTLMNPGPNGRLLDMMQRQVYRNGIPAGSSPSVVANKVGYVDGYRHDVGIIYHPKGAYIISVLSYGGSYPQIVDLSRDIYKYMSR
jgi:beta-lactamase class A